MSKLTWEIKGGDDEISKKRRGEFPKQCPKKSKIDLSVYLSNLAQRNGINAAATGNKNKVAILTKRALLCKDRETKICLCF